MSKQITRQLDAIWNEVDNSVWNAPRKQSYYEQIYQPLYETADAFENNCRKMEEFAQRCMSQCEIV